MKRFLAIYLGTAEAFEQWRKLDEAERKEREKAGMEEWNQWGRKNEKSIVDNGAPVGKTKRIDAGGISDTKNEIAGYAIVEAESHEAAAQLFLNHPHFSLFPGDSIEVMELLPMPKM